MLFFARFPRLTLDAVYQPDADGRFRNAYNLVKDNFSDRKETAIAAVPTDDLINWCNASPAGRYPFAAATCRLFTGNEDDSATEISAAAKSVLNHAPDKLAVAREILSRLRPRSWSGSLSLILEQRLPLLQSLDDNSDPSISIAIAEEMATLRLWIDRERQREAEDERTEALTFE